MKYLMSKLLSNKDTERYGCFGKTIITVKKSEA